jgi:hypothetical protein
MKYCRDNFDDLYIGNEDEVARCTPMDKALHAFPIGCSQVVCSPTLEADLTSVV